MDRVILQSRSTNFGPVSRAKTFREKWRGLKDLPEGSAVLMRTRSVHGFGIKTPFQAVGLTKTLEVLRTHEVKPRRVVTFRRCRYVLELPLEVQPPQTGETLVLRSV